ncbi:MAG TPA: aminodeoxychorismate lyase [Gammaproteobacteria bacterium]
MEPIFLINGVAGNHVPVTDRGLNYGDGLFETIKISAGAIQYWQQHMARLQRGCERLRIPPPDITLLHTEASQLINQYCAGANAVLKIIITRGSGQRGYKPPRSVMPTRIVAILPFPDYPNSFKNLGVKITICETRLASNPRLAGIKHLNRLEQVLASGEWEDHDIVDGIMLDNDMHVIEGTGSNLFWVYQGRLYTPSLMECGIEGILRDRVLQLAEKLQITVMIGRYFIEDLLSADEVFITNSIRGIWPVRQIDHNSFKPGPLTQQLMDAIQ